MTRRIRLDFVLMVMVIIVYPSNYHTFTQQAAPSA